jgi:GMP reductase
MHNELSKHGMTTCIARHYNKDGIKWRQAERKDKLCVMSGISNKELSELSGIITTFPDVAFVGLDVANGYTINFVDAIKHLRENLLPDATIIAGNVVTADMTAELIVAGVDIVKVGIGGGSVCTTRIKTGIGYPQLSAVIECADAAHGIGGHIAADGGCTSSGDIVKAFAGGADFVMIGGMLAGHEECDGKLVFEDDNPEPIGMEFYGMASKTAMDRHGHSNREYRGEEGKTVTIPYRGPVKNTVTDILGSIRSACTYIGARRLKDLSKCTTFVRVNNTHNRIYE